MATHQQSNADIVIVGGGIIGLSTALALKQAGKDVIVIERGETGREASGLNGGGVRQQGRAGPELPLAIAAIDVWKSLESTLNSPLDYRRHGHLYLAENDDEMAALAHQRELELRVGLQTELITPSAIAELAPGLRGNFVGAKFCATDGRADPARTMAAFDKACRAAGVRILAHNEVRSIGVSNGSVTHVQTPDWRIETPLVINAAGPWAPLVAQMADVYLPIYPSRAELAVTEPLPLQAIPFVQTYKQDFAGAQESDGGMRFGAAATRFTNRFTYSKQLSADPTYLNSHRAAALFPALANARIARRWVGIRECTPDMMPILGFTDGPAGLFVAAGFSGHGYCLGPYVGQQIARWLTVGKPDIDLSAFALQRFQQGDGPLHVAKSILEQTG